MPKWRKWVTASLELRQGLVTSIHLFFCWHTGLQQKLMGTVNRGKMAVRIFQKDLVHWGWQKSKVERGHQWLCCSLCWQDPRARAKQCRGRRSRLSLLLSCLSRAPPGGGDSRVSQDLSVRDLCERKWISFMCSVNICIKGSLCHRRRGRAAASFNATAEPISRDKFSTEGGSHRRC